VVWDVKSSVLVLCIEDGTDQQAGSFKSRKSAHAFKTIFARANGADKNTKRTFCHSIARCLLVLLESLLKCDAGIWTAFPLSRLRAGTIEVRIRSSRGYRGAQTGHVATCWLPTQMMVVARVEQRVQQVGALLLSPGGNTTKVPLFATFNPLQRLRDPPPGIANLSCIKLLKLDDVTIRRRVYFQSPSPIAIDHRHTFFSRIELPLEARPACLPRRWTRARRRRRRPPMTRALA